MSSTIIAQVNGQNLDLSTASKHDHRSHFLPGTTSSHEQAVGSWFKGGLPTPPGTKDMTGLTINGNNTLPRFPSTTQTFSDGQPVGGRSASHVRSGSDPYALRYTSRQNFIEEAVKVEQQSSNTNIASHLQIPESVNSSKGSLAEFAAEITCLFWFETAATLEYAANLPADTLPDRGLMPDAVPSIGFRKWVTTMLSTTQVGKNVILLALMFVHRLKKFNPSVSGKRGSEFRLLTIALMLGNKFLDDNTYTNKTWAEVSGISVTEIHIMEVEFLSNMRYELYASSADWVAWKALLGKFGLYYEKAARHTGQRSPQSNPPITPTNQTFGYKLPSPPSRHNGSALSSHSLPHPMTTLPQLPQSPGQKYSQSNMPYTRKRSLDSSSELLPPPKRLYNPQSLSNHPSPNTFAARPYATPEANLPSTGSVLDPFLLLRAPQLPVPRLAASNVALNPQLAPLSLPSARPVGPIYPSTTAGWSQPITPMSAIPANLNPQYYSSASPATDASHVNSGVSSANTSPVNHFGPATPTRPGLSPSYFLTNRSSPYRPVRNVHTLLNPPPSAAMHHQPKNVAFDQMHYRLLGRPMAESRPGPVPFMFPDARQQGTMSTPNSHFLPY